MLSEEQTVFLTGWDSRQFVGRTVGKPNRRLDVQPNRPEAPDAHFLFFLSRGPLDTHFLARETVCKRVVRPQNPPEAILKLGSR